MIDFYDCSGLSLVDKDFQSLLGGIERDSNGQITSATALEFKIIGHMNGTAAKLQTIKADSALGEYVSALHSSETELFSSSYYHLLKVIAWGFAFFNTSKNKTFVTVCHNLFILQVEESTLDFESHLITIFLAANHNTIGMKTYVNVARSFNDIASETIISDTSMVVLGFSVVFMYVTFVMGKFDCIENRVSLQYILHNKYKQKQ